MRLKVLTVVGTRPEIIKLSCVIPALDRAFRHVLVHTGQNYDYELNGIFFKGLGIRRPNHFLKAAGGSAIETMARVLLRFEPVLAKEAPDAMLVLGDTNSCLAALVAKRMRIPVFHMEAGNRSFDERIPEEINRRIIDHISDINLPYTEHARRYLLAEGIRGDTIIKTGSPMKEVLAAQAAAIEASDALQEMRVEPGGYFVASAHREENVDEPRRLRALLDALAAVSRKYRKPVVVSAHPRTRQRIANARVSIPRGLRLVKPLAFADYARLQRDAACTLSDSGTLTEEAALLSFPAVMLRDAHERPEGMDQAIVPMCGIDREAVIAAVAVAIDQHAAGSAAPAPPPDYDVGDVSQRVVNAILSYTGYVNRLVWRRY